MGFSNKVVAHPPQNYYNETHETLSGSFSFVILPDPDPILLHRKRTPLAHASLETLALWWVNPGIFWLLWLKAPPIALLWVVTLATVAHAHVPRRYRCAGSEG